MRMQGTESVGVFCGEIGQTDEARAQIRLKLVPEDQWRCAIGRWVGQGRRIAGLRSGGEMLRHDC